MSIITPGKSTRRNNAIAIGILLMAFVALMIDKAKSFSLPIQSEALASAMLTSLVYAIIIAMGARTILYLLTRT